MKTSCIGILMVVLSFLFSSPAAAEAREDVVTLTKVLCDDSKFAASIDSTAKGSLTTLCASNSKFRSYVGEQLPPSFFANDLCLHVQQLGSVKGAASDTLAGLERVCGLRERASALPPGLIVNIVQGLGDHILAVARADLVDYVTSNLTDRFCKKEPANPVALGALFTHVCHLFDKSDPGVLVDSLTLSKIKEAFLLDTESLPRTLPENAAGLIATYVSRHKALEQGVVVGGIIGAAIYEVFAKQRQPRQLLDAAAVWVLKNMREGHCNFVRQTPSAGCLAALVATMVQRLESKYEAGIFDHLASVIEDSIKAFCHAQGEGDDASCVIDASYREKWHGKIVAVYDALIALYREQDALARDPTVVPSPTVSVLSRDAFPVLANRLHDVLSTLSEFCNDGTQDYKDGSVLYLALIDITLSAVALDLVTARSALLRVLDSPLVDKKLNGGTKKALSFVVSLAAAKDAKDVKDVIDAVAAPVGTYKEKYDRDYWYLAIGGLVGLSVARQTGGGVAGASDVKAWVKRVSMPVGVEAMPSWFSGEWVNLGVGLTVIDPLAMVAVDGDGKTPDDNLGSVLDLGAYLRFGIAKSPISVIFGYSWRPGARSAPGCMANCFEGAQEWFLGVAGDVPLFVLH